MPARATFISGRHVHSHGMWHNDGELAPDYESLFRRLQEAGYYTAHIGKSHYYPHGPGHMRDREPYMHARGFDFVNEITGPLATQRMDSYMTDEWAEKGLLEAFREDYRVRGEQRAMAPVWPSPLPVEDFMDSYVGRKAVEFLDGYERREPFCLFAGFGGPHEPWDAPGEYATMYDPAATPRAIAPSEPPGDLPEAAASWEAGGRNPNLNAERIAALRANYYGKISLIDRWFGEIMAACERRDVLDDLFVVFWSDHGEMAGDHGRLYKSRFYESALRVPLVFRLPGRIEPGGTTEALASTVDLMPTILEAAGVTPPETCEGLSLWPVLHDPGHSVRAELISEVGAAGRLNTMVCTERHKYAVHEDGTAYMLYDLEADPDEQHNLIGRGDGALERGLRQRLLASVDAGPLTDLTS
jgi:choline-sulfatase